jgi:small-conductance mechanosensitive channel
MNSRVSALSILLLAATVAAGQGGETRTAALSPPDQRPVPATPAEGRRLVSQIDAERAALEDAQREAPTPSRARTIQLLEEEIETIKRLDLRRQERAGDVTLLDRTTTAIEELEKRLAQAGQDQEALPDPADPNAEVTLSRERKSTDDQVVEQLKKREDAHGAKTKLELEQETELRRVPAAKRALAEARSDLTDFETDSREAAAGGVNAEQARVMGEQVYVYRLRVAEHQATLDALRFRAGDLYPMLIDRAAREVALAEANLSRLEGRRARIDTLAEKASESRLDRGRAEMASVEKTHSEVAPWAQAYWRLKIELARIQVDVADVSRRIRALGARTAPGGELAVLTADAAAERASLAKVDARQIEIEDVVPSTTNALLQFIERRESELARVRTLQEELRALRKEAHDRERAARHEESATLADVRRVEPPEGVEPAAGAEREAASPSSWEKLRSSLKAAAASRTSLFEEYDKLLGTTAEGLLAMRKSREMSVVRYKSALLWTRDPSEVSTDSLDRARGDLVNAPRAVADGVRTAARSSLGWTASAAREGRIFDLVKVFGALLGAAGLVFWVHKSASKKFAATAGKDLTLGRAAGLGGAFLRQVEWTALLAFAGVVLPTLAGASPRTIAICAAVFVPPFAFRVARSLIDLLFGAAPGERGLLGAPEALARLLARTCVLVLRVCGCFVPLAILLTVTGYRDQNPGVVELLWLLNSIGCYVVVLVVLLRPSGIGSILKKKAQGPGKSFLPTLFAAAYPFVIGAVLFLLVLRSLSYRVATRYFLERFLISAGWIILAVLVRRWLARVLFGNEARVPTPPPELASDPAKYEAQGRRALADRFRRALVTVVAFGPAAFFVLDAWGLTGAGFDAAFNRPLRPLSQTVTLGNALSAILTALVAFFIVRSARDLLRFVILPRTKLDTGVRYTIVTLTTYALVALSAIVILGGQLKVDAAVIGGFVAFLGLGLGFGLQEIVNNFFSGIILLVERPLKVGDTVTIGGTTGRVDRINMRSTTIMTAENTGVIVPNKDLISSSVTNWSAGTPTIRESMPLGIAYGSDTELFQKLVLEVVQGHGLVLKHPAPELVFTGFGASSMDFSLRYWIRLGTPGSKVRSDLLYALDAAFRRHGVEMPFPQQDVHVRTWPANPAPGAPDQAANGGVREPREAAAGTGE